MQVGVDGILLSVLAKVKTAITIKERGFSLCIFGNTKFIKKKKSAEYKLLENWKAQLQSRIVQY